MIIVGCSNPKPTNTNLSHWQKLVKQSLHSIGKWDIFHSEWGLWSWISWTLVNPFYDHFVRASQSDWFGLKGIPIGGFQLTRRNEAGKIVNESRWKQFQPVVILYLHDGRQTRGLLVPGNPDRCVLQDREGKASRAQEITTTDVIHPAIGSCGFQPGYLVPSVTPTRSVIVNWLMSWYPCDH